MAQTRRKQATGKRSKPAPFSASPSGLRVAIYHRVSTLDQDKTLARKELEAWVSRQAGYVAMLVEESASGAWNSRPGLQRVIEAARLGQIDVVIVWKLDRWGRSSVDRSNPASCGRVKSGQLLQDAFV